jgi:3-oxoacyl-[acyl-carrier-protein] synthase-1
LETKLHPRSLVIAKGRISISHALYAADRLIHDEKHLSCAIVGVDGYLNAATLAAFESKSRLLTSQNSNGFIPGEAAAAVLIGPPRPDEVGLMCLGLGGGHEAATVESDEPLRADGMVQAFKAALANAGLAMANVDYRLTDLNGEQYGFKEAALAMTRVLRDRKELFEIWHPADCIGETGAAAGPSMLAVSLAAARKGYAPGAGVLCHFSADDGERAAMVMRYGKWGRTDAN